MRLEEALDTMIEVDLEVPVEFRREQVKALGVRTAAARFVLEGTEEWLCIERHHDGVLRITNLPGSALHC